MARSPRSAPARRLPASSSRRRRLGHRGQDHLGLRHGFSDAIYGKAPRYVSHERLETHARSRVPPPARAPRGDPRRPDRFFVFADTVATQSYRSNNEAHGWIGIRFQTEPASQPYDIILHVRMWDKENVQQQEALGIVGTNLIYGAFYFRDDPRKFIRSLADNVGIARVEVDMLRLSGPAFATWTTA